MNTEPISSYCPKCHAPLPASAPEGLCRRCLLAAVATPTEGGEPANAGEAGPPSLEAVAAAFPQLEILELIGSGGMGVVYKARQPRLDRCVALKLLPRSLAADPAFAERFNREARVLARLNHPGIVTVYDFGDAGGFFFLLMEFVAGVNLRQAMQTGRFTPQQAFSLVPKICEALQFAHDEGILHRDIKPENILLDSKGRVKIADFGIAKLVGEQRPMTKLTATGAAIGTPNYMAPEQLEHPEDVDQRADIYSIGVVFYEMLTGELPIGRFAPPSQKTSIDERVDEIVLKALARERELRQQSASEVKTQVEGLATPPAGASVAAPAVAAAAAAPAPRLTGDREAWSHLAIWGAVLTGLSIPIPLLVVAALMVSRAGIGFGELLILFGCVLLLGVPGTLLGWMALSQIRRSHGQLQGLALALFAAFCWPLLVLFLATLLPPLMIATPQPVWWGPALLLLPVGVVVFGAWAVRAAARWGSGTGTNYGASRSAGEVKTTEDDIRGTLPPCPAASPVQEAVRKQIGPAAMALFIVGALNILPLLLLAASHVVALAGRIQDGSEELNKLATTFLAPSVFGLMSGPVIMVAAWTLKRLASREFAVLACILAMIPPISPAFMVGIPVGIWGLLVLRRPEIKAAFAAQNPGDRGEVQPGRSDEGVRAEQVWPRGVPPSVSPQGTVVMRDSAILPGTPAAAPDWQGVWLGLSARTRLLVKTAAIILAITLAWAFLFYRVDYVKVGYAMVRTSDVGWGTPWLSFWRSPDQNLALEYGLDFFTFSFAAGLGSAALWILVWRLRAAESRANRPDGMPSGKRAPARGAVALWAGLGIMILVLALVLYVWLPIVARPQLSPATNSLRANHAPHPEAPLVTSEQSVSVDVSVPPRETFVVTGIVLSNNVPVSGRELRAKLSPPSGRGPNPFVVRWQTVKDGSAVPPWEIVVEDKASGTIAARLRPANLPQLVWTGSPQAERTARKSVTHEAGAFEVARALQPAGSGNTGAADWSVRLQLQSAPVQPAASKRGIDASFVLPAHQVAVFEVVTRSNDVVVPVPRLATYVINGADGPYAGQFLWTDDPEDLDSLTGRPRWKFGIIGPEGGNLQQGLGVPAAPTDYAGSLGLWAALRPDTEVIEGLPHAALSHPAYGLRIRTQAFKTAPGQSSRAIGQGTNWMGSAASPGGPRAP